MTKAEAIGITWNDIDMKNKEININHQLIYKRNGEERKTALKKDGFNPEEVQKAVNDLLPIINKYKE